MDMLLKKDVPPYTYSETDEVDGAVLSSETILRGVSGKEVLEELQVKPEFFSLFVVSGKEVLNEL